MAKLISQINAASQEFKANQATMLTLVDELKIKFSILP